MKTQFSIKSIGKLANAGEVMRFSFVAPTFAKRLIGLYVFSPEVANLPPTKENVQVSLLVNNEAQIPVCASFSLGMNSIDENILVGQMLKLNAPIIRGERISGYVELLNRPPEFDSIEVKLHLKYEMTDKD